MQGKLFTYTRLEKFDYRLIYAPDRMSLPSPIRDSFIDFVREVVNTDNVNNGEIRQPRWAFKKEGNHILIGVGCYNKYLGAETSGTEKRLIRGFFGVYFDNLCQEAISPLTDMNFYRQIYAQYIQPLWSLTKKDEYKTNSVVQEIDIKDSSIIDNSQVQLNEQQNKCVVLSDDVPIDKLFLSALMCDKVDIVCNLNTIEHVTCASLYSFHNISVIDNKQTQVFALLKGESESASTSSTKSTFRKLTKSDIDETEKPSVHEHSYERKERTDEEYARYVDILLKKLKYCKISIEKFLRILARKCGYILIPKEDSKDVDVKSSYVYEDEHNDSSPNQQAELIASHDIEQFESERAKRRANVADLRRQYLGQTNTTPTASTIEEIADVDNHEQQDDESLRIDAEYESGNINSPDNTLKIEEI